MARATFIIEAVDRTRAAFLSINSSLKNMGKGGDEASKKMLSVGLRSAGLIGVVALLASQVRKVASDIKSVPGVSQDVISSWGVLNSIADATGGTIQNMIASAGDTLVQFGRMVKFGFISAFKGVDAAVENALENERELAEITRQSTIDYDKQAESMRKLGQARKDLNVAMLDETSGQSIMRRREEADLLEDVAASMDDLTKRNGVLTEAVVLRTGAQKDANSLNDREQVSMIAMAEASGKVSRVWKNASTSLRELNAQRAAASALLETPFDANDTVTQEKNIKLRERIKEIDGELYIIMRKNRDIAQQAGDMIASSFEKAIFEGGKLSGVLRGLAKDLLRMIFNQTVTQPIASAVSGMLSGLFKADGGPVSSGTSYIVGEKGPELFTPSQAGRIIPNHQAGGGGGGGDSFSFVYNIGAGVTREQLLPILKAQQRDTMSRLADNRRRGGTLAFA